MVSRIYADNFRCLVNFELKLDRLNLLMGVNGSGKTSVFEVLRRLQNFLSGDVRVHQAFSSCDLTRWQDQSSQRFELDLKIDGHTLGYVLVIEHYKEGSKCQVKRETLSDEAGLLFSYYDGEVHLFRDDYSAGSVYPYDRTLPALAFVQARNDNQKLTAFRKAVARLVVAGISPAQMESTSREEEVRLAPRMENFVSWYRRLAQENMGSMVSLFAQLQQVLTGFDSFSFRDAGESVKELKVLFSHPAAAAKPRLFDFQELSDGQRVLVVLYTLIYGLKDEGLILFLDEPDNYVTIQEIQPWLRTLSDACGESFEQAVLISHHPEIINYMGGSKGCWLERNGNGPVRVSPTPPKAAGGLELAETMARGLL